MSNLSSTYQTRIAVTPEIDAFLSGYADRYNYVERTLYADMQKKSAPAAFFKNDYLIEYGISARQFNAIGRNLEGKIDSVLELLDLRKQELTIKLGKEMKTVKKLKGKIKAYKTKAAKTKTVNIEACAANKKNEFIVHQKNRKIDIINRKLTAINIQKDDHDARLCFGSKALFRKQFNPEINGYANHAEWQKDWRDKRNSQFYVLGSGDEETGCQGCRTTENSDGTFNLKLRSLSKVATYLEINNVSFKYGSAVISNAILCNAIAKDSRSDKGKQLRKLAKTTDEPDESAESVTKPTATLGAALSYRFMRDAKGWRLMITTDLPEFKRISVNGDGFVGLDINADCITMAETNRHGNLIKSKVFPLVTYGKTTDQAEAIICEVAKQIVAYAVSVKKPIVMENLSFKTKKAALSKENKKHSRMLSSLSYNKIIQAIKSRAYRHGIVTKQINPAYTSVIGLVNHVKPLGLSVHQAAAYVIARRGSDFRERPITGKTVTAPTPKGDHVTFPLPARNRENHLWTFWRSVKSIHTAVLAAHFRPPQGEPSPSGRLRTAKSKAPEFTVRPRDVNRQQNCSAGVLEDDIPW